eukprot:2988359-Pyramimonas_sp.AAC.1
MIFKSAVGEALRSEWREWYRSKALVTPIWNLAQIRSFLEECGCKMRRPTCRRPTPTVGATR